MSSEENDSVNRPSHYTQYKGFEVMDVCMQLRSPDDTSASAWFRGNAFKYLARAGWKNPDKEIEDLEKAAHYIQREIERLKAGIDEPLQKLKYLVTTKHVCPQCNAQLLPSHNDDVRTEWYCPEGHGRMVVHIPHTDTAWMTEKTNDNVTPVVVAKKACPTCYVPLVNDGDLLRCPNGHGYLDAPNNRPPLWVPNVSGDKALYPYKKKPKDDDATSLLNNYLNKTVDE